MKTLIVINNLGCGGAQKSLISLLNELTMQQMEIDLLVLNQKDVFFDQIPAWINQIGSVAEISAMHSSLGEGFKTIGSKAVCIKSARILNTIRYRIFGMFGNGLFRCKAKNTT